MARISIELSTAQTDHEIAECFDVLAELRPHLQSAESLVEQVRRQEKQGYCLTIAYAGEHIVGVVGYRIMENLHSGRFVYVDDLVVSERVRNSGVGARLLRAAAEEGVISECTCLVLDSSISKSAAHQFYFNEGVAIVGFHFSKPLTPG